MGMSFANRWTYKILLYNTDSCRSSEDFYYVWRRVPPPTQEKLSLYKYTTPAHHKKCCMVCYSEDSLICEVSVSDRTPSFKSFGCSFKSLISWENKKRRNFTHKLTQFQKLKILSFLKIHSLITISSCYNLQKLQTKYDNEAK